MVYGEVGLMKLVSWNVRGLGAESKRDFIRIDLQSIGAVWVGLQETKLRSIDFRVVNHL